MPRFELKALYLRADNVLSWAYCSIDAEDFAEASRLFLRRLRESGIDYVRAIVSAPSGVAR